MTETFEVRRDQCCLLPKKQPVLIQLGRFGDVILLLPAFWLMWQRTAKKPIVIISHEYASVLDGVSYVQPHVFQGHWFRDMPKARAMAERYYGSALIPHWWSPGVEAKDVPPGPLVLQCHGDGWSCDPDKYTDFGTSMWLRAGFTREEMISTPLLFDRRNPQREAELVKRFTRGAQPMLLVNFTGNSSPFGYTPELWRLLQPYRSIFNIVDLGQIRAQRIYDLLGLMDQAVGIITIDTSTLHLCPATKTPSLMFIVDGWGQAVPRGNCAYHCFYSQVPKNLDCIQAVLDSWKP